MKETYEAQVPASTFWIQGTDVGNLLMLIHATILTRMAMEAAREYDFRCEERGDKVVMIAERRGV